MLLKDHILREIKSIESPNLLNQVFEYIQVIKQAESHMRNNHDVVMKFAGLLSNAEAKKISTIVSKEFNHIEGEW
jgi:uncharacterized protein YcbK (DUF882 family)